MDYYYSWKLIEPLDSKVPDGWLAYVNQSTTLWIANWAGNRGISLSVTGWWQTIISKLPGGIKIENSWNNEWQSFNPEGPLLIWEAANRYLTELSKEKCKDLRLWWSSNPATDWLCNDPAEKEVAVGLCGPQAEYKPILCPLYT